MQPIDAGFDWPQRRARPSPISRGQLGYEGQPGNQGGASGNPGGGQPPGPLGYEGHPGNQGGP